MWYAGNQFSVHDFLFITSASAGLCPGRTSSASLIERRSIAVTLKSLQPTAPETFISGPSLHLSSSQGQDQFSLRNGGNCSTDVPEIVPGWAQSDRCPLCLAWINCGEIEHAVWLRSRGSSAGLDIPALPAVYSGLSVRERGKPACMSVLENQAHTVTHTTSHAHHSPLHSITSLWVS